MSSAHHCADGMNRFVPAKPLTNEACKGLRYGIYPHRQLVFHHRMKERVRFCAPLWNGSPASS
jgi:hypothetical protein